jgi:hypothetical protein
MVYTLTVVVSVVSVVAFRTGTLVNNLNKYSVLSTFLSCNLLQYFNQSVDGNISEEYIGACTAPQVLV